TGARDRPRVRVSWIAVSPGTLRFKFEEVAGATEHACQTFALGQSQAQPQQDLAGIKQVYRPLGEDSKTVVLEIPSPPTGMEQPQSRNDVPARPMPTGKAETDRMPSSPVPGHS